MDNSNQPSSGDHMQPETENSDVEPRSHDELEGTVVASAVSQNIPNSTTFQTQNTPMTTPQSETSSSRPGSAAPAIVAGGSDGRRWQPHMLQDRSVNKTRAGKIRFDESEDLRNRVVTPSNATLLRNAGIWGDDQERAGGEGDRESNDGPDHGGEGGQHERRL